MNKKTVRENDQLDTERISALEGELQTALGQLQTTQRDLQAVQGELQTAQANDQSDTDRISALEKQLQTAQKEVISLKVPILWYKYDWKVNSKPSLYIGAQGNKIKYVVITKYTSALASQTLWSDFKNGGTKYCNFNANSGYFNISYYKNSWKVSIFQENKWGYSSDFTGFMRNTTGGYHGTSGFKFTYNRTPYDFLPVGVTSDNYYRYDSWGFKVYLAKP